MTAGQTAMTAGQCSMTAGQTAMTAGQRAGYLVCSSHRPRLHHWGRGGCGGGGGGHLLFSVSWFYPCVSLWSL